MPIFLLIILGFVGIALIVAVLIVLNSLRTKGTIARSLNMVLVSVTLPRPQAGAGASPKPEKDLIAVMEQLYGSFANLHASGWNKFVYGEPYLAFEIAVKNIGQDIHFFAAVPRTYKAVFEKQVHGFFPEAEIEDAPDYNIFHPHGAEAAAYLALKENSVLPIQTYRQLPSDPLSEILTSLSKIEHQGEGAAIQILLRPSHQEYRRKFAHGVVQEMQRGHHLKDALTRAYKPPKEETPDPAKPQPQKVVTAFEEEIMKAIQGKASRPLFDVCTRLVVSADDQTRAQQILNDLAGSFVQFSTPQLNSFTFTLAKGATLKNLLFNFSFRIFDRVQPMLLSSEELASIYHFPISSVAPRVKFLKSKPAQPPLNLPQEGISLGVNVFRGAETAIRMDRSDRRRHMYLLGQTGTGKTTLIKNMIVQDIAAGDGVCFIDPHGTGIEEVLELIPPERASDVIVFDPSDIAHAIGLNMLEFDPRFPEQKTFIVNELLSIFQKLFLAETMGPMFDQYFRNAVLLLLDDAAHEPPTLLHIPRVLTDAEYRREKLTRETNPIVKHFWEQEAEKAGGEAALANMAPYITSKINGFIANEYLRPILSQSHSSINFREIMDQRKILLVNLSKGRIGDINANLLGMLIVGKLLMAALSRVDVAESARPDFYLYIDEFQNFTTDSIATILSEARKYHLDLTIANQFIKQLADKIRDAVFGNVGSLVVFRVGADDAEYLKTQFEPVFSAQDLMNIDNFNAYAKLLIRNQTAQPFNIRLNQPPTGDRQMAEHLKDLSRQRYGRTS
ncbi:MAG TPA: hypothetical protein VG866_00160 [Candidatus Paceibacterota bacterium]|nr:hypothetical protein [Candidatus Paceibacterota bacterium]